MLVTKRQQGDLIRLTLPDGRECEIVVHEIGRNWVRLTIEAPQDVRITREQPLFTHHQRKDSKP